MVLEQLFKERWIEKKSWHALFLGMIYSVVGIISAKIIFGANPGLMSVAFTSILLVPSLNKILAYEENVEIREKKFSINMLIRDHIDIFEIYFFMFLGVFIVFAAVALLFSQVTTFDLFEPQLKVAGFTGNDNFYAQDFHRFYINPLECVTNPGFSSIIINNIIVLAVCLILSLVYGAGSILFLTWNAAVWGAVFGYVARGTSMSNGSQPFLLFAIMMVPILPHMITEALSYFTAAIVGGVVSKATLREKIFSNRFHHIITDALLLSLLGFGFVILAGIFETCYYGLFQKFSWIVLIVIVATIIGAIYYHKKGNVVIP